VKINLDCRFDEKAIVCSLLPAAAGWAALWLAGTAEFALARILPGPRTGE
jgi:hypothetical protein